MLMGVTPDEHYKEHIFNIVYKKPIGGHVTGLNISMKQTYI